jgi:hypothetical protein
MRILYYALGGGHGHVMRGLALLRRARQILPDHHATLIAPRRLREWARREEVTLRAPPDERPSADQLTRWVEQIVDESVPDLLLVDQFPRGILGELQSALAHTSMPAWLISRWVRPRYFLQAAVRQVIERRYSGMIWCEAPPDALRKLELPQYDVGPIVIRTAAQCLDRSAARAALRLEGEHQVLIALGSGSVARQRDFCRLLRRMCARVSARSGRQLTLYFVSAELPSHVSTHLTVGALFPAMRYLRAADLVVTACGYHACHETRSLGLPAVFVPQRRLYDDQFARAAAHGSPIASSPQELERLVGRILDRSAATPPDPPLHEADGASAVVRLVA